MRATIVAALIASSRGELVLGLTVSITISVSQTSALNLTQILTTGGIHDFVSHPNSDHIHDVLNLTHALRFAASMLAPRLQVV